MTKVWRSDHLEKLVGWVRPGTAGTTGTGVRGTDRGLLVEGEEGLRGSIRRRRRRGEPTFSWGRPEYLHREEEDEDW